MSLRTKILTGYAIALVLLGGVVVLSFSDLRRLGSASDAILSENYRSIQAAGEMLGALERQQDGVLRYLSGNREDGIRNFREGQSRFQEWLGRAKDNVTIEGEETVLTGIESAYSEFLDAFTAVLRAEGDADPPAAGTHREVIRPAVMGVREAVGELRSLNETTMFDASRRARTISRRSTLTVAGVGLLAVIAVVMFSTVLSGRLTRPIHEITLATRRIAEGDYDVEVPARTSDELGELARRFNDMAAQLRSFRDLNVEQIVAEKRKSEAIVDSIDDPLFVVDEELRIVNVNRAARRHLDGTGRDPVGRHLLEVIPREEFPEDLDGLISGTTPSGTREIPGRGSEGKDRYLTVEGEGRDRHFQVTVTSVRLEDGEAAGAVVMLRDMTRFRELDRMKSEFVATASHQLKTPLTSIGMSLQLLREHTDGTLEDRDRELLKETLADVDRLQVLVEDLLQLSRLQSGRIELDFQPVEVPFMCERILQAMAPQAEEREIVLTVAIQDGLPPVRADMTKATWVLTNLLSNALRYAGRGGEVRIRAERAGEQVEISVADDGPGIPVEYQARIFERFVRVEERTSEGEGRSRGTGLGLAICREIVRAHGGRIWVDSEPGRGSAFHFTLPSAA